MFVSGRVWAVLVFRRVWAVFISGWEIVSGIVRMGFCLRTCPDGSLSPGAIYVRATIYSMTVRKWVSDIILFPSSLLLPLSLKVKEVMFSPLSCLFVSLCARYLKKLWTGLVCDEAELIKFW